MADSTIDVLLDNHSNCILLASDWYREVSNKSVSDHGKIASVIDVLLSLSNSFFFCQTTQLVGS